MTHILTLKKSIEINSSVSKVWEVLTNPELIKLYFFGTNCVTDWKKGSQIFFRGEWDGKAYEDKGTILDIENEKFIYYNYWSSFSGTADIPENYANIRYELTSENDTTIFTVIQEGFKSKEALEHSETNWGMILEGLKKVAEQHVKSDIVQ
jgi:uncharacterized protein YndB with AHSA1/START domain